ncbi:MAG: membrane protein insertase YidC [Elusimicrobia bacterium]|nr:membrane protein insertase YidC [Elusimicrobiota bacterium]
MQKNLILAVALSSAVYILWYAFIEKPQPRQTAPAAQQSQNAGTPPSADGHQSPVASSQSPVPGSQPSALSLQPSALKSDWQKDAVEIKLAKASYFFHAAGASVKSIIYQGPVAPLELILEPTPGFLSSFENLNFTLKNLTRDSVAFSAPASKDITVTKKFTLNGDNKINLLEISAFNSGKTAAELPQWHLKLGPGLGTVGSEKKENPGLWKAQYTVMEEGRKHPTIKKLKETRKTGEWLWAGIDNRYFLAAVLAGDVKSAELALSKPKIDDKEAPLLSIPVAAAGVGPNETRTWRVEFYIGPKDYKLLKELGRGLDRSVDFGFFSPLAKLANSALIYFYNLTGNYGTAIVILSVILQLLLTPLSIKSYKAMAVMKKIQPEMQSIQARYKNDPKRLNSEILELYKKHGTNPLGGCLPMLLQIPVFFALFTALRESWALHGAPFVFWIKDLSAKDPYYVLPLVMGGIMFLQQHLNPQGGEPTQAAMMKWMPVVFTFMFLTFPSGLVLYWLINSVWGFAQTMYMKNKTA